MYIQQKYIFKFIFTLLITIGLLTRVASAENLYLAGFSSNDDEDSYGYVGAIIPILGSSLDSDGTRIRLWGSYTSFEYDGFLAGGATGIPTSFEGDGPGSEIAIGHRWSFSSRGTSTTYVGIAWKDIDVDPTDPGTEVEDEEFGLKLQQEIDYRFSDRFDLSLIGSFTGGYNGSYFARIRPGYTFNNGWKLGPEIVAIGAEVFDKQRYGAFLSGIGLGNFGMGFSLGIEDEASTNDDAFYGSVSVSLKY